MSDEAEDQSKTTAEPARPIDPGFPERPKLRRRPLGYKRTDVDAALEKRDSELSEMRQDVAALWLAFAQHDRMIRSLGGETPPPLTQRPPAPAEAPAPQSPSPVELEAASIGSQLSELDEVLAAIEMATQTLERTYSDEIEVSKSAAAGVGVDPEQAADAEPSVEEDKQTSGRDEPEDEKRD